MVFAMCVCYLYWILQFCYERVIFINVIYLSINSDELCDCTEWQITVVFMDVI